MDVLSPSNHEVKQVAIMKGAQTGGTEVGLNLVGFHIGVAPCPIMFVQPTIDVAKKYSRQRLQPMLDESPQLRGLVKDSRSRDSGNTMLLKDFRGGTIALAGANSAASLRSLPMRILVLDEVDAYPLDVDNEGDPIELAINRTAAFSRAKVLLISTPTVKGVSRIEEEFDRGDQRYYYVPCPDCGEMQRIVWARIVWPKGKPREAALECEHCGVLIAEHHKSKMLAAGEWRAHNPLPDDRRRSYHLSALYAPYGWEASSWGSIAEQFKAAKSDPSKLKPWVNTKLGETFDEGVAGSVEPGSLLDRREDWGDKVPADVGIITAGVDVQQDRLECEVVGWGVGEESWSLDYVVIPGDPTHKQVWEDLHDVLSKPREREGHGARTIKVSAVAIDSGYATSSVYDFCKAHVKDRYWAVKGREGKHEPIWPQAQKVRKKGKQKVNLHIIGVDQIKDAVMARLNRTEPGGSYCHFPMERTEEYFDQLTAERKERKYFRGRFKDVWVLKRAGARNEAFDVRGYAYAALHGLYGLRKSISGALDKLALGAEDGTRPVEDRLASSTQKAPPEQKREEKKGPLTPPKKRKRPKKLRSLRNRRF